MTSLKTWWQGLKKKNRVLLIIWILSIVIALISFGIRVKYESLSNLFFILGVLGIDTIMLISLINYTKRSSADSIKGIEYTFSLIFGLFFIILIINAIITETLVFPTPYNILEISKINDSTFYYLNLINLFLLSFIFIFTGYRLIKIKYFDKK